MRSRESEYETQNASAAVMCRMWWRGRGWSFCGLKSNPFTGTLYYFTVKVLVQVVLQQRTLLPVPGLRTLITFLPLTERANLLPGSIIVHYTQTWMLRKQPNFSRSVFLTFTIYFVSEQGNRFGAKVISLGYLGYLNFYFLIFSVFSKLSVRELGE